MPDRERRRAIWVIALPIMGGMMSQNVLNLVDIGMVGRLGDAALAATGLGSFANYLSIAFIIGLSAGVQALAARRLGEGREEETAVPLNGGLLLSLLLGLPLCAALFLGTPWAFQYLTEDPAVAELGAPYLQVRLLSMVAVGMNFSQGHHYSFKTTTTASGPPLLLQGHHYSFRAIITPSGPPLLLPPQLLQGHHY